MFAKRSRPSAAPSGQGAATRDSASSDDIPEVGNCKNQRPTKRPRYLEGGPADTSEEEAAAAVVVPAAFAPRAALVKVGDDGGYSRLGVGWDVLSDMDVTALLGMLYDTKAFGPILKGVALSWCDVRVLKGCLPPGKVVPDAADEAPDNTVRLEGSKTISRAAQEAGCTGEVLWVRVTLPAEKQLVEQPPRSPLARLAAALPHATLDPSDKAITLPEGASWPGMASPVLYVRHFYKGLWEGVLNSGRAAEGGLTGAALMGTPGIGKSAFGLYALYRAVAEGRTVVYDSLSNGFAVFKGGKAFDRGAGVSLNQLIALSDPNTLYISDGIAPGPSKGSFILVVTSLRQQHWSTFFKRPGVRRLTLPPYDEAELMGLRGLAFAEKRRCSVAEVQQRFVKWDGNPRNVLTQGHDILGAQTKLEVNLWGLSLSELTHAVEQLLCRCDAEFDNVIHRVLNLMPCGVLPGSDLLPSQLEYYVFSHTELASLYVADKYAKDLLATNSTELYQFLRTPASEYCSIGDFRGVLYERLIAAPRLEQGAGELRLQRLTEARAHASPHPLLAGAASINLTRGLPLVPFNDAAGLAAAWTSHQGDALFAPRCKQRAAVDFVIRLGGQALLVDTTMSKSHNIEVDNAAFTAVLAAVGLGGDGEAASEIPFLWVLPADAYERFTEPGPLKGAKSPLASGPPAKSDVARRLVQYKLLLPVPPAPSSAAAAAAAPETGM